MTSERYGIRMDDRSARIVDRLDEAFADIEYFIISNHSGLCINNNRYMDIRGDSDNHATGKVPREVFRAIREAGFRVTGIHTGVGEENEARVWVENIREYYTRLS